MLADFWIVCAASFAKGNARHLLEMMVVFLLGLHSLSCAVRIVPRQYETACKHKGEKFVVEVFIWTTL